MTDGLAMQAKTSYLDLPVTIAVRSGRVVGVEPPH